MMFNTVRRLALRPISRHIGFLFSSVFFCGLVYLGFFCVNDADNASRCPPECFYDEELFDDDDKLSEFTLDDVEPFNISRDVLVFLHVQKTGGTMFGRHLVRHLSTASESDAPSCRCPGRGRRRRCDCEDSDGGKTWLFSRDSTGWACGVHADWTELNACVPDAMDQLEKQHRPRRYLYFTLVREPTARYLSEWKHVQRGSTWQSAQLVCDGRPATLDEVPYCFQGNNWTGVRLDEFLSCRHNLAHDRQTRMLADLRPLGCYNHSALPGPLRRRLLLRSAVTNLRRMAFFGLTNRLADTARLFERRFGVHFDMELHQYATTHGEVETLKLSSMEKRRVHLANQLDTKLYNYARRLFERRMKLVMR